MMIRVIFVGLFMEIALIIYDPTQRLRENYPRPYDEIYKKGGWHKGISQEDIYFKKNHLGFRGPKVPEDLSQFLSIITIGTSTTATRFVSDQQSWTALLGDKLEKSFGKVWINNAGVQSSSTIQYQFMLDEIIGPLQPDYVIYMPGVSGEKIHAGGNPPFRFREKKWIEFSKLISKSNMLLKGYSRGNNNLPKILQLTKENEIKHDPQIIQSELKDSQEYLKLYEKRLIKLIQSTKLYGIRPVLLTHPILLGKGIDPTTGVDLEKIKWNNVSGKSWGALFKIYNDVIRKVAKQENIILIDLANLLPVDSKYHYDAWHYTILGNEKVSDILSEELIPNIKE